MRWQRVLKPRREQLRRAALWRSRGRDAANYATSLRDARASVSLAARSHEPHGFAAALLVVVVSERDDLAVPDSAHNCIRAAHLDAAALAPRHHPEQRNCMVFPCRKDLNLLHPPALPALAPPRHPLEEAVVAAVVIGIENVGVLDLDLGIKLGGGGVQVPPLDSRQQAPHDLHV